MLLISMLIAGSLTNISCGWAQDPVQLHDRLGAGAGIGLGGAIPTMAALTAQHAPQHSRNGAVTRMFLGYPIGAIVGGALTAWVMARVGWRGRIDRRRDWRYLAVTADPTRHSGGYRRRCWARSRLQQEFGRS